MERLIYPIEQCRKRGKHRRRFQNVSESKVLLLLHVSSLQRFHPHVIELDHYSILTLAVSRA